jgi:hypothetical protein
MEGICIMSVLMMIIIINNNNVLYRTIEYVVDRSDDCLVSVCLLCCHLVMKIFLKKEKMLVSMLLAVRYV